MLFRGLLVGAASGKLGSLVASHNKGGQYMRSRTVPSGRVPSAAQSAVRNAVSSLATQWGQTLTDDQRAAWTSYALNVPGTNALGDSIQLSGQNWYIACNVPRLQATLPRIDDAPEIYDRGTPTVSLDPTALATSGGTINLGSTVTLAGTCLIYQGRPYGMGRNKYYGSFQLAGSVDMTGGASAVTFTPAFPLPTGSFQDCLKLVFTNDDGRLSTPQLCTFQQ